MNEPIANYVVVLADEGAPTGGRAAGVARNRALSEAFRDDIAGRMDGGDLSTHVRAVRTPRSGFAPVVYVSSDRVGATILSGDPRVAAITK